MQLLTLYNCTPQHYNGLDLTEENTIHGSAILLSLLRTVLQVSDLLRSRLVLGVGFLCSRLVLGSRLGTLYEEITLQLRTFCVVHLKLGSC